MTAGTTPNLGSVMESFYHERLEYGKNLYFQFGDTLRGSRLSGTKSEYFAERPDEGAYCSGSLDVLIDDSLE